MMRCSKVYAVLLASFVFCQPCITFTTPVQARSLHRHRVVSSGPSVRPHQRVYLLRGFMNVFSLGMDQLAAELRQRGVEAVVGNHTLSDGYASEAAADCKAGRINSIAIVGHSLGAGAGVEMADELGQAGVRVGLLVTVDPVNRTSAPANVRTLENFYVSGGVGQTVARSSGFRGSLQNIDMRAEPGEGHVALANSARMHRAVLGLVRAAAGVSCR
jgi:pimeloyl-ACP methyl ester carboxylesterase